MVENVKAGELLHSLGQDHNNPGAAEFEEEEEVVVVEKRGGEKPFVAVVGLFFVPLRGDVDVDVDDTNGPKLPVRLPIISHE